MQDVEEPQARTAFIWILGEHGQTIQVALDPVLNCVCMRCLCSRLSMVCLPASAAEQSPLVQTPHVKEVHPSPPRVNDIVSDLAPAFCLHEPTCR